MKTTILLSALIFASLFSFAGDNTASVTLTGFNGDFSEKQTVELNWKTMMESHIEYYEIQRSGDGVSFQVIDSIASKMQNTTNDYALFYNYIDARPLSGISYYRVKVIGKDGYSTLSAAIQITNETSQGTKIFPTVVQNNVVVIESEKTVKNAKMEFFDLSGYRISETNFATLSGRETVTISKAGKLHNGTYIARLSSNGTIVKNQVIIIQ